ncbi:hypothetical protein [Cryobacterium luteum]|uniref:Uncharacterized protein n=1 Tax=Cryobacterium luteum TaxID=1424661 RepID=A0A5F0D0Z1_9MICO|nr:hypothetical protein [Cryobacterium luteum]TFB82335.1 hypothetical protein E3O10_17685 [Cryobacterium luteum]
MVIYVRYTFGPRYTVGPDITVGNTSNFTTTRRTYRRHTHSITIALVLLFFTGLALFLTIGSGDFVPVYSLESSETILPTQAGESLGSPYLTVDERKEYAGFTTRGADKTLANQTVALTADAAQHSGSVIPDPIAAIIDDADAETARYEIETCTLTSGDVGPGARPSSSTCTDRQTLHIPTIAVALKERSVATN